MNKISIFFLVIAFITYDDPFNLSNSIDILSTEPYLHFDWLDNDHYTIRIVYQTGANEPSICFVFII